MYIENADATPPDLEVIVRLGSSCDSLCFLHFFGNGYALSRQQRYNIICLPTKGLLNLPPTTSMPHRFLRRPFLLDYTVQSCDLHCCCTFQTLTWVFLTLGTLLINCGPKFPIIWRRNCCTCSNMSCKTHFCDLNDFTSPLRLLGVSQG
jgi:hypothetical protein